MKKALSFLSLAVGSVMVTYAQGVPAPVALTTGTVSATPLTSLLSQAQGLVSALVPFLVGLAVVVFFWYLIVFIVKGNSDPESKSGSLKGMGLSILAIFVMVAIWGIIGLLASMLGIGVGGGVPVPRVP